MDDLVERLMRRPTPAAYQRAWAPRLDLYETETEYFAVVELPDVDPSEVTIEIEGDEIAFTGQRAPTSPPHGGETLQLEIPFGPFERRLTLPSAVDAKQATADFKDGMLMVRLPKLLEGATRVQVDIQRPE
jgi:HSP20 family protein